MKVQEMGRKTSRQEQIRAHELQFVKNMRVKKAPFGWAPGYRSILGCDIDVQ